MLMTEEQKEILEKALLDKWFVDNSPTCPICHGTEWEVNPNIFEIPDYQGARKIVAKHIRKYL